MSLLPNPHRRCAFTKCLVSRNEAFRLVRLANQTIVFDKSGEIKGRSIHIAKTKKAMELFCNNKKKPFIAHLLKSDIPSLEQAYENACVFCKEYVEWSMD